MHIITSGCLMPGGFIRNPHWFHPQSNFLLLTPLCCLRCSSVMWAFTVALMYSKAIWMHSVLSVSWDCLGLKQRLTGDILGHPLVGQLGLIYGPWCVMIWSGPIPQPTSSIHFYLYSTFTIRYCHKTVVQETRASQSPQRWRITSWDNMRGKKRERNQAQ